MTALAATSQSQASLTTRTEGGKLIVEPRGDWRVSTIGAFDRPLARIEADYDPGNLVIDLSYLGRIDTAGAYLLGRTLRRCGDPDGDWHYVGQHDTARRLMAEMRFTGDRHRSLRRTASRRPTTVPDVRRTVRAAMRSGGEPISRHHRRRATRLRRLVLLLDVSGSMEPYARALLRFVQAAVAGRQRVEAFAIGTRLTRVTRELGARDPDAALAAATDRVHDWSGGTRLGPCLRAFNDEWGIRGMARGATVVVLSDGWDRGDPEQLAEEMQRLQRVAHRVVWVNPLKTTPGYAPLARGMAAALPFVDDFVEGPSIDALEQLAAVVAGTVHSPPQAGATRP